ncbi:uncharacterized protein LOC135500603 [Lineus longissimus]|uniref:uncharacterized protein LOC135500603 n=1 Tax=Lineus longissimus TaxID=88925 RepID=UPI00315D280B
MENAGECCSVTSGKRPDSRWRMLQCYFSINGKTTSQWKEEGRCDGACLRRAEDARSWRDRRLGMDSDASKMCAAFREEHPGDQCEAEPRTPQRAQRDEDPTMQRFEHDPSLNTTKTWTTAVPGHLTRSCQGKRLCRYLLIDSERPDSRWRMLQCYFSIPKKWVTPEQGNHSARTAGNGTEVEVLVRNRHRHVQVTGYSSPRPGRRSNCWK